MEENTCGQSSVDELLNWVNSRCEEGDKYLSSIEGFYDQISDDDSEYFITLT